MLVLKRIIYFTDFIRCSATNKILTYGDWYYQDSEDGTIIDAVYYAKMKNAKKENEFDYSKLNAISSEREYKERLRNLEREFLNGTVLDKQILGKDIKP